MRTSPPQSINEFHKSLDTLLAANPMPIMNDNEIKANYKMHDHAYQKRRQNGLPGWDSAEVIAQSIREMSVLLDYLSLPMDACVLDLGCGAGNLSFWLDQKGFQVYGTDVSATAIEWAKELAEQNSSSVQFCVSDATQSWDYPQDFFDLVMDNHCLHCIIGADRQRYLHNVYSSMKPGGYYILSTMSSEGMDRSIYPGFDPHSRCIVQNGIAIRYLGKMDQILHEIHAAAFSISHHFIHFSETESNDLFIIAKKEETP